MSPRGIYFPNSPGCPGIGWGHGSEEVSGYIVGKVDCLGGQKDLFFRDLAHSEPTESL